MQFSRRRVYVIDWLGNSVQFVYDAGALVAAERQSPRLWQLHKQALQAGGQPIVPAAVLAQVWRGRVGQANLSRLLRGCRVQPDTEDLARAAGVACGNAGTADVVDALVVVVARQLSATVVTSDLDDLRQLANAVSMAIALYRI